MPKKLKCPTVESIVDINKAVVDFKKITKAEKHELIRPIEAIQTALQEACTTKGDAYKKAAVLLKEVNQGHFFGSANKRTSYVAAVAYLKDNNKSAPMKTQENAESFLQDVRSGKASLEDIRKWLKK